MSHKIYTVVFDGWLLVYYCPKFKIMVDDFIVIHHKLWKWRNCKTKANKALSFSPPLKSLISHQIVQHEFSWAFLCNNSSLGLKSMLYTHCGSFNNGWISFVHSTVTRFSKYSKYFLTKYRLVSWTSGWCKNSSTWKQKVR